jgi:16S rRNA processing protein RimM
MSTSSTDPPGDPPPRLLEVGRIVRAHGIRGEVVVELVTDRLERVAPGAVLVGPAGELRVEASRPHQGRWLVGFAGVAGRDDAEALRGGVLRAAALDDPGTLWVHDLIGGTVVDADGEERGTVVAVEANPASDLLVLGTGALVPLRFVTSATGGRIVVEAPPGLFD